MKAVFVDTSYYQALISKRDEHHEQAIEMAGRFPTQVITTEWVLVELLNSFSRGRQAREDAVRLIDILSTNPEVDLISIGADDFANGLSMYRRRPDKNWSLVDCISFGVMRHLKVTHAATFDDHFEQAGFQRFH